MKALHDAWAAGIIDGEGCIDIKKTKRGYLQVGVYVGQSQPSWPILDELHRLFGGHFSRNAEHRANRLPIKQWGVVGKQAHAFLRSIRPHLVAKSKQAEIALAFRLFVGKPGSRRSEVNRKAQQHLFKQLRASKNYRRKSI
jgi:hypothetical protein